LLFVEIVVVAVVVVVVVVADWSTILQRVLLFELLSCTVYCTQYLYCVVLYWSIVLQRIPSTPIALVTVLDVFCQKEVNTSGRRFVQIDRYICSKRRSDGWLLRVG
jgi:hypothetical protein